MSRIITPFIVTALLIALAGFAGCTSTTPAADPAGAPPDSMEFYYIDQRSDEKHSSST